MREMIIDNTSFTYDEGCKILKLKYKECPFPELEHMWNFIVPITFQECMTINNVEKRRVCINYIEFETLINSGYIKLVNEQTLVKKGNFIKDGKKVSLKYDDTYKLYTFALNSQTGEYLYFVQCIDISTGRKYQLWVNRFGITGTNGLDAPNAIAAIAWTFMTNIKKGDIKQIIRQGDCIMYNPVANYQTLAYPRHLTEIEYRTLLINES